MTNSNTTQGADTTPEQDALHVPSIGEILHELYPSFPDLNPMGRAA